MDSVTRHDVGQAITQSLAFYGKKLHPLDLAFWFEALDGYNAFEIKESIREYHKTGKFAPKPAHLIELIQARKTTDKYSTRRTLIPEPEYTPCPTHIADAWRWFIRLIAQGSDLEGIFGQLNSVDAETQEQYLLIVNQEAKRTNNPDAVPFEYRLKEVWQ